MIFKEEDTGRWDACRRYFFSLTDKVQAGQFDDRYLLDLIEFRKLSETDVETAIFYALYAAANGSDDVALEYAEKAYHKRKINLTLWRLLRDCFERKGDAIRALIFAGFTACFYADPIQIPIPRERVDEAMLKLSLSMNNKKYAPVTNSRMRITDQGVGSQEATYVGEFLPQFQTTDPFRYWSGVYAEREQHDIKTYIAEYLKDHEMLADYGDAEFVFDIMRAKEIPSEVTVDLPPDTEAIIVPLAGKGEFQQVWFQQDDGENLMGRLAKWQFQFFRLNQKTKITSKAPFILGKPIPLGHSPKRRKVVINIFLDALSWQAVKERNYDLVPNIMNFFRKGVIFDDTRTTSEFTLPAYPAIETGMYPHHTQIFNEKGSHSLNADILTLGEQMRNLGYYCTVPIGSGDVIYDEVTRGYDRLIVNQTSTYIHTGVGRAIQQLQAFHECDQFMVLHTLDAHPWSQSGVGIPLETQTQLSLHDLLIGADEAEMSVNLTDRLVYRHWVEVGIREADRSLKELFDFIEANYQDDEYLITLYSDHGTTIYDKVHYRLSKHVAGSAFMVRGGGVPAVGLDEELVSTVDIYPVLAHLLGFPVPDNVDGQLPAVFGGKPRKYAYSMSMFPAQTFKLNVCDKEHECRVESREVTDEDGRVDLRDASVEVYDRRTEEHLPNAAAEPFIPHIRDFTREIDTHGMQWPDMRAKRPEWYGLP